MFHLIAWSHVFDFIQYKILKHGHKLLGCLDKIKKFIIDLPDRCG